MKTTHFVSLFFIVLAFTSAGQTQQGTTSDGKKIILNPDWTWRYAKTEKDSAATPRNVNCNSLISTYIDKVSGNTSSTTKKDIIVLNDVFKKGFGISLTKTTNGSIILSIHAEGAGNCINGGSGINFLFTDGTRMELVGEGDNNCNKEAVVYFDKSEKKRLYLEQLKTLKIKTLRVWTDNSYVENNFSTQNQDEFLSVLNCLDN